MHSVQLLAFDSLPANQVYDQPPFFLVPEDGEDDFAERLQALADPEFQNAVVVGQLWLKVK